MITQAAQAMKGLQEIFHEQTRKFKSLHCQNDQLFVKNNELGNALNKAESNIRRLETEAAARQAEFKMCMQDRERILKERDNLREEKQALLTEREIMGEEKQSLLTEREILEARVKMSEDQTSQLLARAQDREDALQEALIVQQEEKDKTEAALMKLKNFEDNNEENLAQAYNEGVTEAYAKIKADLPELEKQYKSEGWFLALQKLNLDPDQVGMAKGPAPNAKLPTGFEPIIDLDEEEEEKENTETDSDIERDDQDTILPENPPQVNLTPPEVPEETSAPKPEIIVPSVVSSEVSPTSSTVPVSELESALPQNQDPNVE